MTARAWTLAATFVVLAISSACTPRIRIARTQPPRFQLPADKSLALVVEQDGAPLSASTVLDTAIGVTQGQVMNKALAVEPLRSEFGAQLRGAQLPLADAQRADLLLTARPVDWSYQLDEITDPTSGRGRLEVRIEVRDARDPQAPPLFADTYWATAGADNLGEPEAMIRASRLIAVRFLEDLQPSRVWDTVELDDDDKVVEPGIELCKNGQFDAAYAAFTDIVAAHPNSAPALYNLAVLSEARGEYDAAEALLGKATRIEGKALYYGALERVRRARRDAVALQGTE